MSTNALGRYQILREIARSNDIVYEAVDPSINRRVALKELLVAPNLTGAQRRERVERFYREARAAGTLTHPNIVTIYEAGEDQGRHFIAMEFLEGQTLRDVLEIESKLSIEKAVDFTKQVCEGLAYAHSKGVVHRDIKPDNIQVLPSGLIKITDFGIARIMEEPTLTADGQVFGTPSYMSPEQVAGRPLDQRTDIFSLGIVLFEMLTGRKPFTGDSVVTITYNIINQDVVMPPYLPPYIDRVLRRCLAKDPNLRYSSTTEMAADLDPNAFDPYQQYQMGPQQPDPFGRTISAPGPLYGPPGPMQPDPMQQYPQPGQPPQNPYGGGYPANVPIPGRPARKPMSPEAKYFLKVTFTVIMICAFLVGFVWMMGAAYQGYQQQARMGEVQVHLDAGRKHFEQQSYQAAIQEYGKVLTMTNNPEVISAAKHNISVAYISLGSQYESAGNAAQATACYQQAVAYEPTSANAYLFLGNVQYRQGREDAALSSWSKALEHGGGTRTGNTARESIAAVYNRRGDAAYAQNDLTTAGSWWRQAVDIAPGTQPGFLAQEKLDKIGG